METQLMKSHPNMVEEIIDMLKYIDVDGETMQYILKEVCMEEQMLRQLAGTSDKLNLKNTFEDMARKVYEDILNNDTLIYNTFEEYWNNFKQ